MARHSSDSPYQKMLRQRRFGAWTVAVLGAAGLNLVLFSLVPYLFSSEPEIKTYEESVSNIRMVRMREPEPDEPEPLEPEEEKEEEKEPEPREKPARQKPEPTEMSLPFEVNPRLPSGPQSLAMPEMMAYQVSAPPGRVSAGDLDQPLRAVSRVPPRYPMSAKRKRVEGWVKVSFTVDKDGEVRKVRVLAEEPEGVFGKAVRDSVSRWRFEPGTVGGVPVKTVAETTIRFELD
ncbi:MAG: energy transducer TonB [Desulfurivibrio sp.]|nr:energy transducer TonB [Desulfurivibrio sp.]